MVEISLQHEDRSCCDADDCCSNELEVFQLKNDFLQRSFSLKPHIDVSPDILFQLLDQEVGVTAEKGFATERTHSPPFYSLHTLLAIIQVFRL